MSTRAALIGTSMCAVLSTACALAVSFDEYAIEPAGRPRVDPDASVGDSAPVTIPTGPTIYVAPHGSDTNDGLTGAAPKQTIRAAADIASAGGVSEIRVCRGTFVERGLRLSSKTSLRGGFDCTAWSRPERLRVSTPLDPAAFTTIVSGGGPALEVAGVGISATETIEGFLIHGPKEGSSSDPPQGAALLIRDGAGPRVRDNVVMGGGGTNILRACSVGLWLGERTHATVTDNHIEGGTGILGVDDAVGACVGSVGLFVRGAAETEITSNEVVGGTGRGDIRSSAAIVATGAATDGPLIVRANRLHGGNGSGWYASGGRTGLEVTTIPVVIEGNTIRGSGDGPCNLRSTKNECVVFGIHVRGSRFAVVEGNHVLTGATPFEAPADAIAIFEAPDARISNNFAHAGSAVVGSGGGVGGIVASASPRRRRPDLC